MRPMQQKVKCWEFFKCRQEKCPAHQSRELKCWLVSGTRCRNEIQGGFIEKAEMCLECEPFKNNLDKHSMEETLRTFSQQFREFRHLVEQRDRQLEQISMEMALGLSEVFVALERIAAGDPDVRVPTPSELDIIARLKQLVNLTAEELGKIMACTHEFAITLAEHFDVLKRAMQGDLEARVTGTSNIELLALLKDLTNAMIASVSREITERKQKENTLRRRENKLSLQAHELGDLNRALRVLLKRREEDRVELEEKVFLNIHELILPYVERLKTTSIDLRALSYLSLIESRLKDIVAPFARGIAVEYTSLTPTEIEVAQLVRHGRTTKEIATLMSLSPRTIETHRKNIRAKMALKNKKTPLRTHLMSLGV